MIIAGTGHRPKDLGGYSVIPMLEKVAFGFLADQMLAHRELTVISGMAQGWDMALAWAAVQLDLPLWAYIPFKGQESVWPTNSQNVYHSFLEYAEKVKVCSEGGYSPEKMQIRNERMVDDCDMLAAYWSGKNHGGTYNCIRYAQKVNKPITNLYKLIPE